MYKQIYQGKVSKLRQEYKGTRNQLEGKKKGKEKKGKEKKELYI